MRQLRCSVAALAALACLFPAPLLAQGSAFQTPGMPGPLPGRSALQNRFVNNANPAIGAVVDLIGDYTDNDGTDDGGSLALRGGEISLGGFVDPSAWAYGVLVAEDEGVALEEAAFVYTGFDSNLTLKGGRFFLDFGKQMQAHIHDLRTVERPLVLRTYLGEELGGDGIQLDNWFTAGEEAAVRYSFAAFQSLSPEIEEDDAATTPGVAERDVSDLDQLAWTARLTGFMDVGDNGTLQIGASARALPEFTFELPDSTVPGGVVNDLDSTIYGFDLTYGYRNDEQTSGWSAGGEFLLATGDIAAEANDAGVVGDPSDDTVNVVDDDATGWYAWVDFQVAQNDFVGAQYSMLEQLAAGTPDASELEVYWTRNLSDFQRIRLAVSHAESDTDPDALRVMLQWTNFLGPHSHGINW